MSEDLRLDTPKAFADAPKHKVAPAPKAEPVVRHHRLGKDDLRCTHGEPYQRCNQCHPPADAKLDLIGERPNGKRSNEWIAEYCAGLPPLPR